MTNCEYEALKQEIIKEVSSADLQRVKLYFESCIQSRRSLSKVKSFSDILFLLEMRDLLQNNDVTPLLCIGEYLHNNKIVELTKAYEKLFVETESCVCGNTDTFFKPPNLVEQSNDADVLRVIDNIAHNIGPKWRILVRELKTPVRECEIDEISEKYHTYYEQASKALLVWKQKKGEYTTVEDLKEALESRFCKMKGLGLHILEPPIIIE